MPVCGRFRKSPQAEPDRITGSPDNRLPRNEFRGIQAKSNQKGIGNRPIQENSPNRRKLSDKNVTKGYRYEDGKVHNGSNYRDYCIFFISLYRASPFAVSRYFCLG